MTRKDGKENSQNCILTVGERLGGFKYVTVIIVNTYCYYCHCLEATIASSREFLLLLLLTGPFRKHHLHTDIYWPHRLAEHEAICPWKNGKEVPRWGVAEIQKMSPSTTGRCYTVIFCEMPYPNLMV